LFFFRPPSDPLQIRRVHFSDSPTPKVCHQDYSFTADPLSRYHFGTAELFLLQLTRAWYSRPEPFAARKICLGWCRFLPPVVQLSILATRYLLWMYAESSPCRQFWLDFGSLSVQMCVNRCREKPTQFLSCRIKRLEGL
jgi:hypothetical protein